MRKYLNLAILLAFLMTCSDSGGGGGSAPPESLPAPDPVLPSSAALQPGIAAVTSTSVTVVWPPVADTVRILLGAEPGDPDPVLLVELPPGVGAYQIGGLAPAIDYFIRLDSGGQSALLHTRTLGGPRAPLDGFVREVLGVAPNIVMVVFDGWVGPALQVGWSATRRNGAALPIVAVHRHSVPVSAPAYSIGYGLPYSDEVLEIDHRIFLVFGESIGNREMLSISGPAGTSMLVAFSDRYLETPSIQVNQVGYNPRATERWAYVSGWMGDGGPVPLAGFPAAADVLVEPDNPLSPRTAVVGGIPVTVRNASDPDAGGEVRQIDLSGVAASESARYRVRLPGVGVSWRTAVSEKAAFKAYYTIARGIFHNRWHGDLTASSTEWSRPPDHPTVYTGEQQDWTGFYPETTPLTGERPMAGGHHDAGDFDLRPMHTVVPQLLMRAFELDPSIHADGQLTIPESGNLIPDLLDEALWGAASLEQLQEADGGVRAGAESWRHPWSFYFAHQDPLPYWTYARDANATARAAGVFAQASRLVEPWDPSRAASLLARALQAWDWALANGAAPAYRLYAAGELLRLTGSAVYATAFEAAWNEMGPYGAFSSFALEQLTVSDYVSGHRATADYLIGYAKSPAANPSIVGQIESTLADLADDVRQTVQDGHAHRNARPPNWNWGWGAGTVQGRYADCVISRLRLGGLPPEQQQGYFDTMSVLADFALGCNPAGRVYFTGLGTRRVREPLHLDSLCFIKQGIGPIPGIPVFGPVVSFPNVPYLQATAATFHPALADQPPGWRYADIRTLPVCNEFTVWECQAPHASLFAALIDDGMMPPASWLPGGADHGNPLP